MSGLNGGIACLFFLATNISWKFMEHGGDALYIKLGEGQMLVEKRLS